MERVRVGKIVNTHGIKGELKVKASSDFIAERFGKGEVLILDDHGTPKDMTVLTHRLHKGCVLVTFVDHQDINLVEKYKGCTLYAQKDLELLEEGEYYIQDLIGCDVYNYGVLLGCVKDVHLYDHHDVLVVEGDQKVLIPYVDAFVKAEDVDKKRIDVELIEGFYYEN